LAVAAICLCLAALAGCGESVDYNRLYDEGLAERAIRERAATLGHVPSCTSIDRTVVSNGPCVFEGPRSRESTFGGRAAP